MPTDPHADREAATPAPAGAQPSAPATPPAPDKKGVSRIARITLGVLLALFVYNLFADRITPYTSQATIGTFLVQIAPQVSGQVVAVDVRDNQQVKKGQPLFRIDPVPLEIAQRSAEANLAVSIQNADSSEADVRVADAQLSGQRVDLAATEQLGKIVVDLAAKRALAETQAIRARADIDKTRAGLIRAEAENGLVEHYVVHHLDARLMAQRIRHQAGEAAMAFDQCGDAFASVVPKHGPGRKSPGAARE